MLLESSTSSVMVFPVSVLTKICIALTLTHRAEHSTSAASVPKSRFFIVFPP